MSEPDAKHNRGGPTKPLTALDWQEMFLAGARAARGTPVLAAPNESVARALEAMAGKAREIAERQRAA